jgi:hypothetical protein
MIWRYRQSNLGQDLVSRDEGNVIRCLRINEDVLWNAQGSARLSRADYWSLIGEVSRLCLEYSPTCRVSHLRVYDA